MVTAFSRRMLGLDTRLEEGVHRLKTIFRYEGKHCTAVYFCELPNLPEITDEWIESLCPEAHGWSQVKFDITRANGKVRWSHLVNNEKATVAYDIEGAIVRKLGWDRHDPRVTVKTKAAVPGRGRGHRTGSTRLGVPRRSGRSRETAGLTAQ